jgi:hypothetical protein
MEKGKWRRANGEGQMEKGEGRREKGTYVDGDVDLSVDSNGDVDLS